jgi:hypothetical protein
MIYRRPQMNNCNHLPQLNFGKNSSKSQKAARSIFFEVYSEGLRQNFDILQRKILKIPEKLLNEFQKIPNLSKHFYVSTSKAKFMRNFGFLASIQTNLGHF